MMHLTRSIVLSSRRSPTKEFTDAFTYCVQVVRTRDSENYVWCTQLPKEIRPGIFALRAFHVETASVPERSGEGLYASMRYQWWIDAISNLYKQQPSSNPVFKALSVVLESRHLTRYRLIKIVETRRSDALREKPFQSVEELELYGEGTSGQLLNLQLEAAGIDEEDHASIKAASSIGRAISLANALRGAIHHAVKGRFYFPQELLTQYNVTLSDITRRRSTDGVKEMTRHLVDRAHDHLAQARNNRRQFSSPNASSVLLPATVAEIYLSTLRQFRYDLFDPKFQKHVESVMQLKLQLYVKWRTWIRHF